MPIANKNWRSFEALLDPTLTLHQVEEEGYDTLWKRGCVCPNRMLEKQNHDVNCTVCDGTGFLYDAGTPIKSLTTSIGLKQMWQTFGRFDVGMAIITVNPKHKMSWWDLIEFPDEVVRYTEILKRGPTLIDKAKYKVKTAIRVVDHVGTDYAVKTDFNISTDGKFDWTGGAKSPALNSFYSVSYLCSPRYVILEMVHQFRNSQSRSVPKYLHEHSGPITHVEFPLQAIGKLDFLIGDESRK